MPILALPLLLALTAAANPHSELPRLKAEAARVTITRDDWGIAHVHGPTDADAVFGMIYAQAEDDFPRVEHNYLVALGRTAEAEGENAVWQDLRSRLYYSPEKLRADYAQSPDWLKRLMNAWADGLNYYLAAHRQVHPRAIKHFEPWMALSFTEGSIGGDIERISLDKLASFYCCGSPPEPGSARSKVALNDTVGGLAEPQGSNGIAISPKITAPGSGSLLLINPHTSLYFRSELQMKSDQGLDAYGAVTWGQFFIYQGFNPHAGWMHSSTGADSVDQFAETIERRGAGYCYRYGNECRPLKSRAITIHYRSAGGAMYSRTFTTYATHHGPIVASDNGKWLSFAMMDRPIPALEQSFGRTKATDLDSFLKVADLKANSSNNTIFADDKGEIAYLHPQFVPVRDDRFDYTKAVDGSDPATDWHGLTPLDELPSVLNPPNGWVDNNNNSPWSAAGANSPKPRDYPKYMDMYGENYRGLHALRLLTGSKGWTADKLNAAAFDSYQPGFARLIPPLLAAYDALPRSDPGKADLAGPIKSLRGWDYRWDADSVPQSVATFWAYAMYDSIPSVHSTRVMAPFDSMRAAPAKVKLAALETAVKRLRDDFGRWDTPWGEINRFQRLTSDILSAYSDDLPSIAIPFASGNFGSLASAGATAEPGTKRWYTTSGNSFVAVVHFAPGRVSARAVTAGGESGDPDSPHFNDQAQRYASGKLRTVYFYPDQLNGHTERTYHPGG